MPEAKPDNYTRMKECTPEQQFQRDRISPTWEPNGFDRYQYQQALTRALPVVGGPGDQFLPEQRRYAPAKACQDTLDCQCGNH